MLLEPPLDPLLELDWLVLEQLFARVDDGDALPGELLDDLGRQLDPRRAPADDDDALGIADLLTGSEQLRPTGLTGSVPVSGENLELIHTENGSQLTYLREARSVPWGWAKAPVDLRTMVKMSRLG